MLDSSGICTEIEIEEHVLYKFHRDSTCSGTTIREILILPKIQKRVLPFQRRERAFQKRAALREKRKDYRRVARACVVLRITNNAACNVVGASPAFMTVISKLECRKVPKRT